MSNIREDANAPGYFFWNQLDLFFPIQMRIYDSAKVLNTFLFINWLTIYLKFKELFIFFDEDEILQCVF